MRLCGDNAWYLSGLLVWIGALITRYYCLKGFVILTIAAGILFLRPSLASLLRAKASHGS